MAAAGGDLSARLKDLERNSRLLESAAKAGGKLASFCANCHGEGGNSIKPDVPNLAGQNAHYLLRGTQNMRESPGSSRCTLANPSRVTGTAPRTGSTARWRSASKACPTRTSPHWSRT